MLLSAKDLSVSYDETVLENISFTVNAGEFLCIIGQNGGGKSTLCKAILGLVPLSGGCVITRENLKIGYVPQECPQEKFPASAEEIVRMGVRTRRPFLSGSEKARVLENMRLLGILDLRKKNFETLSGGQKRRVFIARALTASDGVLLLDEPASGLDPLALSELYALLRTLCSRDGITVIMVSHDMDAALSSADKLLYLDKTLRFFGTPADFLASEDGKRFLGGERNV